VPTNVNPRDHQWNDNIPREAIDSAEEPSNIARGEPQQQHQPISASTAAAAGVHSISTGNALPASSSSSANTGVY